MHLGTYGNGIVETTGYNNRLQVTSIIAAGSSTLFSKTFGYYDSAEHDNGDILSITDALTSTHNQTFTYDSLNRILTGAQADNAFNIAYSYDPWGNMKESGTSSFQVNYDLNNRVQQPPTCTPTLQSFCYDPAGDLLMDNHGHVYTFDGEARIKTVDSTAATYTYDAQGNRVRKDASGTATEYVFFAGNVIAEKNPATGTWTDYIFAGGKRIAKDTSSDRRGAQYYHDDQIGTARVMTDSAGTKIMDCIFNPFGEQVSCLPDNPSNHYRFTGKERDSETGLDDMGARYYSSTMGRFSSPDPLLNSGYPGDPQSWNRYSYVRNNPMARTDPTGLYDVANTCDSSDKQCNKNFEQYKKDLKNGLKNLQDRLNGVKNPQQRARLETALKAIGSEGEHNGVTITFGATKGGGAGETDATYDTKTNTYSGFKVTLDPKLVSGENDYAKAGAHEGTHVSDYRNYELNPATFMDLFQLEYRGYQTSAYAASALGESSLRMIYEGKSYLIWNGSWEKLDKNITNYVTQFHDKEGNKIAPETIPHNPQPN